MSTTAGDLIVACTDAFNSSGFFGSPTSVTDTAGNTYHEITTAYAIAPPASSVWYAQNTTALTPADSVTATWTATFTGQVNLTVLGVTGAAQGGALDQVVQNYTTASELTVSTGKLALTSEVAIASWVSRQAQGAPEITAGWTSLAAFQGAGNTHYDNVAWQIVDTAAPVTASASTPSAGTGWAVTLVTFRGQLHPTATLSCGGSAAGYPVRTVDASALLGCGGSIIQPGTYGQGGAPFTPYPPPPLPIFPAGYGPGQADFGGWVQNSFGYLTGQIVFRAEQRTSQSIPATTFTPISFDTVLEDLFGGWTATPSGPQPGNSWLAPYTGWYRIIFRFSTAGAVRWTDAAVAVSGGFPQIEAAAKLTPTAQPGGANCSVIVPMIGGTDYAQGLAWASTTASTNVGNAGVVSSIEIIPVQVDLGS